MQLIFDKQLISVAVLDQKADAIPLAQALLDGGLDVIEVTFRTAEAAHCISAIREAFPAMLVGAGTILTPEQARQAKAAGAQFAVAPGFNESVVAAAQQCDLPFFPGVMTPSDVEGALRLGCVFAKFFPAEAAGGVPMLKALAGPYAHTGLKFIPTGGIGPANLAGYLALPIVAAVGGSWMCERKLLQDKDWNKITALTAEAVNLAGQVKLPGMQRQTGAVRHGWPRRE
ncbi:MAG: bifunctional 4-hydroxy-2-oxoglutarate aldolase/2-dehydro-3-deoxy-phosphogluconate aldolase [Verrucomicrobia bacterium]|nr:bifunctional 4-hydroxy-2-oxoglutarate aldolase/2-dehydro-3-deoxy-phosphogluconate aldolase [Verrucomicrobiota bacterium]